MITREPIYQAMFALLSTLGPFKTKQRFWTPWSELGPEQQPALMMVQKHEDAIRNGRGIPIKWSLKVDVVLYANTGGVKDSNIPASVLNPLVDAIEAALGDEFFPQTLGGLCETCWINGTVEHDEGVLGNQGWSVIPIEIVLPA